MEPKGTVAELIDAYEAADREFDELNRKSNAAQYRRDEISKQIRQLMDDTKGLIIHNGKVWTPDYDGIRGSIHSRPVKNASEIPIPISKGIATGFEGQ